MNKLFPQHNDHPLFRYFTDEERRRIEKIGEVKTVRANNFLIRARDLDSRIYTVEEGHLDIVAKDNNVLATVGPGDVLGEVSFIDDSPRTVSVRAGEENAVVRAWNKKALSEALAVDPQLLAKFSVALCELLVERLRDTARRV
jgi:CRP/FNR family transcriptional regulator, cyclic AMP receptor protein